MKVHLLKHVWMGLALVAGLGAAVMCLWNWLTPAIFGWETITFWQALGMLALARILFGSLGGHGRHFPHPHGHFREKWQQMTPEEREAFIRRRRQFACGGAGDFYGGKGPGQDGNGRPEAEKE
ncbi:MAG: hypothetical protein LBJ01_05215 [Tannerella sp.]|jgi:hypothetical protein|nr:hypothetical protein [Tannerella sp.]